MEIVFLGDNAEEIEDHPLSLKQANEWLQDMNQYLIEHLETKEYPYKIYDYDQVIFENSIELPIVDTFTLVSEIAKELSELEGEDGQKFREYLLPKLGIDVPQIEEIKKTETTMIEEKKIVESDLKELPHAKRKKSFLLLVVGVILIVIGVFVLLGMRSRPPTYEELIKQENYQEAGKVYPKKIGAIEQHIYDTILDNRTTKTTNQLQTFNKAYPTTFGTFDLAIFNKKYNEAITAYELNRKKFESDNERMILVGYAYLKEDKLTEAQAISKQTQSTELDKKIYSYQQLQKAIEEKNKELKELEKDGSKNRDQAEKVASEKFDLQEQLLNL